MFLVDSDHSVKKPHLAKFTMEEVEEEDYEYTELSTKEADLSACIKNVVAENELEGDESLTDHQRWYHPSNWMYRYTILFFTCMLTFGSTVSYDSISAIAPYLQTSLDIGADELGLLIAVYSLPNLLMVFLGGILLDKIGYNRAGLIFNSVVMAGAIVVACSQSFQSLLVGRILFGLGSESLFLVETAVLAKWFSNKELALALSVGLASGRVASIFALWTLPSIAEFYGWRASLWFVAGVCGFSWICNIVLFALDRRGQAILMDQSVLLEEHTETEQSNLVNNETQHSHQINCSGMHPSRLVRLLKKLPLSVWLVFVMVTLYYASVMSFTSFIPDFLHEKWDYDPNEAAQITSLMYFISLPVSLLVGWCMDFLGHRTHLVFFGSVIMIPAFAFLAFTPWVPFLWMIVLGVSFSITTPALWTIPSLLVSPHSIGLCYGILSSSLNTAHFFSPVLFGWLREITGDWMVGTVVYGVLMILCTLVAGALWHKDRNGDKILQKPSKGISRSLKCRVGCWA